MIPFLKKVLQQQFIIKICGLKDMYGLEAAGEAGASAVGFMAYKESRRHIDANTLTRLLKKNICPGILKVGVFVNPSLAEIEQYMKAGIDIIQLHGAESPEFAREAAKLAPVWKAFAPSSRTEIDAMEDYPAEFVLLDSFSASALGGTGRVADWNLAAYAATKMQGRMILAGGLTVDNVADAIRIVRPAGVDVSSGVESGGPGVKKKELVMAFVEAAHKASLRLRR